MAKRRQTPKEYRWASRIKVAALQLDDIRKEMIAANAKREDDDGLSDVRGRLGTVVRKLKRALGEFEFAIIRTE